MTGELRYVEANTFAPRPGWAIRADPHIAMRIKRVFSRVAQNRTGIIWLTDTLEVARDLEWLVDRHPLEMDDDTRKRLFAKAAAHREREQAVAAILSGDYPPLDLREPVRPAREYQSVAADLCIATGHLLCVDELGLGKSMTGILVLRAPDALPALVVTLTHLPRQWIDEINKTLPWLKTHVVTSGKPYPLGDLNGGGPDVLVINYHKLAGWADHLAGVIRTVIFDEAQELRRGPGHPNKPVLKNVAAARVADGARYRIGLTATPVYNYGGEIHNVMSVLAPDALGSKEEFTREWGAGSFNDHVTVRDPHALGCYLRDEGLMIGRTRKEVGRELPDVIKIVQSVESDEAALDDISGDAIEIARLILASATKNTDRWKASGDLDWKLRQATGIAKAPYVAEFVRLLLESEERIVLFGWHRAVYNIWRAHLTGFKPTFFTGTESPRQKAESFDRFAEGDSRVLIMSLRAGAGLDGLQELSHVAVFGELDWSPQVHGQCIGRLHRDGQNDPVVAYYLVSDDGSDPVIAEVLQLKRSQSEPMLDPEGKLFVEHVDNADRVRRLAEEVLRRAGVHLDEAAS